MFRLLVAVKSGSKYEKGNQDDDRSVAEIYEHRKPYWTGKACCPCTRIDEILKKNGKRWKVSVINHDFSMTGQGAMTAYRVYLTDMV
jgi:hypothetical protein